MPSIMGWGCKIPEHLQTTLKKKQITNFNTNPHQHKPTLPLHPTEDSISTYRLDTLTSSNLITSKLHITHLGKHLSSLKATIHRLDSKQYYIMHMFQHSILLP